MSNLMMPSQERKDETPFRRDERERRRAGYRFYKRTNEQFKIVGVAFGILLVGAVLIEAVKVVLGLFGVTF